LDGGVRIQLRLALLLRIQGRQLRRQVGDLTADRGAAADRGTRQIIDRQPWKGSLPQKIAAVAMIA
jgi:hypothetical protein